MADRPFGVRCGSGTALEGVRILGGAGSTLRSVAWRGVAWRGVALYCIHSAPQRVMQTVTEDCCGEENCVTFGLVELSLFLLMVRYLYSRHE